MYYRLLHSEEAPRPVCGLGRWLEVHEILRDIGDSNDRCRIEPLLICVSPLKGFEALEILRRKVSPEWRRIWERRRGVGSIGVWVSHCGADLRTKPAVASGEGSIGFARGCRKPEK